MSKINLNLVRKNPLTIPVLIADKKGLFKKHNVEVNLGISEDFAFNKNQDFYDGEVDAMVGDLTFFFYILERGKKAVITSNLTRTINLVGSKNLTKDLDGIRVGVNRSGLFRLYLENDLRDIVPNAKIEWINNTYERMQALEDGRIDALVAIEPFVTDVVEKGGKVIWNSRDSEKNLVMWAFDENFYLNNKETIKDFHNALEEAIELFNRLSPEDKVNMCIECAGYSKESAERLRNFNFEKQDNFRIEDFDLCQEWMYRENEITKTYNAEELICKIF